MYLSFRWEIGLSTLIMCLRNLHTRGGGGLKMILPPVIFHPITPSNILIKSFRSSVMKGQTFLLCDFINNFCFGMDNYNVLVFILPLE